MSSRHSLRRRDFVKRSATFAGGSLIVTSTLGCQKSDSNARSLVFASLEEAVAELDTLANAKALVSDAEWNWAQTLNHCAQSIEYSLTGYPQAKSALFQRTVGAAAFDVFAWRGRMTHDLAEPIPGAPALDSNADPAAAVTRLRAAIEAFNFWPATLQPHFAYGPLSKEEYAKAHAMHLAEHFSHFHAVG